MQLTVIRSAPPPAFHLHAYVANPEEFSPIFATLFGKRHLCLETQKHCPTFFFFSRFFFFVSERRVSQKINFKPGFKAAFGSRDCDAADAAP